MYGRSPVCKAADWLGAIMYSALWCSRKTTAGPDEVREPTPNQSNAQRGHLELDGSGRFPAQPACYQLIYPCNLVSSYLGCHGCSDWPKFAFLCEHGPDDPRSLVCHRNRGDLGAYVPEGWPTSSSMAIFRARIGSARKMRRRAAF
jgi:hypothetical protein